METLIRRRRFARKTAIFSRRSHLHGGGRREVLRAGGSLAALAIAAGLSGCSAVANRPELEPNRYAPPSVNREWNDPAVTAENKVLENMPSGREGPGGSIPHRGTPLDLSSLIEIALQNNPETSRQWQQARASAAQLGAAEAPYYPQLGFDSSNGYQRTIIELPGTAGALKQWQAQPTLELTYLLLDFGRRRSAVEAGRDRLIAEDFKFNRVIQDVVFATQASFYELDAARSAVTAAQRNLALAETDFAAVGQRVNLGLATEPELLLSKERVAQSRFELANARLLVHDAEARMAVALGLSADELPNIQGLGNLPVPASLGASVEGLIAESRRQRPDLAARVADLHSAEANVANARSQFFPSLGLSAGYGENIWNFTFYSPQTVQTLQPQYSALLSLRWDIFTGLKRVNDLRAKEAEREVARSQLSGLEIDASAEVWRAYYEYQSSVSKYAFAQSLLAAAQESYDANLETYRQGLSTIVELLTAERDLANARYTLIQSKAELLTSYAAVAYAAGRTRRP